MTEPSPRPWPLHPQPRPHEDRRAYLHRLAEVYRADYRRFCRSMLGLTAMEISALGQRIPDSALHLLAAGTRLPADQLRDMQYPKIMNDAVSETRAYFESDEEREWFEHCFGETEGRPL